ncbi:MAG: O-antigen ligase family protein [bacterium]
MKKLITWHIFPFLLCFWYTGSYILQPFPACAIAALVIAGFTYTAFRNPAYGAIAAVFCMPLTLSLGRHLIAYLGESAPVYLPYAEMILIATLWGWVWRALLHQYHPERFPIIQQEKTGFEQLILVVMGVWALLTVLGVFPALYRNLTSAPAIPWKLVAVKLAFAPVWGLADEFFPITVALRTLLALGFLYYAQRLVQSEGLHRKLAYAFSISMALVAIYAIVQVLAGIGYSKGGRPEYYVQSTFHENEGFASFCLIALTLTFLLFMQVKKVTYKIILFLFCLAYLFGIALSGSRAVMLLTLALTLGGILVMLVQNPQPLYARWKAALAFVLLIPAVWFALTVVSPRTVQKIERLALDYEVVNAKLQQDELLQESGMRGVEIRGGSLTLVARIRLWNSALRMLSDSWGLGMGTGSYYRLTGFPRYQAMSIMENAHFFWLQFLAEVGLFGLLVMGAFLLIPAYLMVSAEDVYQKVIAVALLSLWFCNIVGQSLLQHEILWWFALVAGLSLTGALPAWKWVQGFSWRAARLAVPALTVLILIQMSSWWMPANAMETLGIPRNLNDTYGYHFDNMGHRYLQVGSVLQEEIFVPTDEALLEFRVHPAGQEVSESQPLEIRANIVDSYNRIIASNIVTLTTPHLIVSLPVRIENQAEQRVRALLMSDRVDVQGNIFKSQEREQVGFHFYGYRWLWENEITPPNSSVDFLTPCDPDTPRITWEEREAYEQEGREVFFTDCGLYRGGSDELVGAVCQFTEGEWRLVEPRLEPADNLIENGDFTEWDEEWNMPIGFWYIVKEEKKIKINKNVHSITITNKNTPSLSGFVALNHEVNKSYLKYLGSTFMSMKGYFKLYDRSYAYIQVVTFEDNQWHYLEPKEVIVANDKVWESISFCTALPASFDRLLLRISIPGNCVAQIDDLTLLRGFIPINF